MQMCIVIAKRLRILLFVKKKKEKQKCFIILVCVCLQGQQHILQTISAV